MKDSYFTDPRDGETYRTVKIGNRIWFAENLRHKCEGAQAYAGGMGYLCLNGETPPYDWNCDPNVKKYGLCYYWKFAEAAVPKGWRLPNNDDWRDLFNAVGAKCEMGEHGAETYLGAALALKSKDDWEEDELFPVGVRHDSGRRSEHRRRGVRQLFGVAIGFDSKQRLIVTTMPFSTVFGTIFLARIQSAA